MVVPDNRRLTHVREAFLSIHRSPSTFFTKK
jgi:hypothetical protein